MRIEQQPVATFKEDIFGRVELVDTGTSRVVRRIACGGGPPGFGLFAKLLAWREQRILAALEGLDGVPRPLGRHGREVFYRSYIEGVPLYRAGTVPERFWTELLALVEECHAAGVTHNDLAKEANVLVTPEGRPALVDFQAAMRFPGWTRYACWLLFDVLRREDRRHALKHKAFYRPDLLTPAERQAVAKRSLPVRLWAATLMKPYQRVVIWLGWEVPSGPAGR